jgi:hypothetical protein
VRLKKQFEIEYPFYDESYYSLPCNYHITDILKGPKPILDVWLDRPANVAKLLYRVKTNQSSQTGGRLENILKIEKPLSKEIIQMNLSKDKAIKDLDIDKYFSKNNYRGILNQKGLVQKMFPQVMRDDTSILDKKQSINYDTSSNLIKLLDVLNSKPIEYTEYFDTDEKIGVEGIPVSNFFNKQYLKEQIKRSEKDSNSIETIEINSIDGLATYVLEIINENSKKTLF